MRNAQGDVVQIRDSQNQTVANYHYDAWGKLLSITDANGKSQSITNETFSFDNTSTACINPIRYRGYIYDNETGFYYLNSRYYDPSLRRFVNEDSFASTGQGIAGYNMFAYCNNNPVMYCDPSGQLIQLIVPLALLTCMMFAPLIDYGVDVTADVLNSAGLSFLNGIGCNLSAWMYNYAFTGKGGKLENDSLPPMLEEKLINSNAMHSKLKYYVDAGKAFDTKDQWVEFSADNDKDLYYSMQHVNYRAWGWKENGRWKVNVIVWDKYDFGEFRIISEGFSKANAANDMGTVLESIGEMTPYEWWIRYEYYY